MPQFLNARLSANARTMLDVMSKGGRIVVPFDGSRPWMAGPNGNHPFLYCDPVAVAELIESGLITEWKNREFLQTPHAQPGCGLAGWAQSGYRYPGEQGRLYKVTQ